MIGDAVATEDSGLLGRAYVDGADHSSGALADGDKWLQGVVKDLRGVGIPTVYDQEGALLPSGFPMSDCILYYGWYAEGVTGPFVDPDFHFAPGAVAVHIYSFSASTLRSSQAGWVAPLLSKGATASLGNVYEPYLQLTHHLDIFDNRLLQTSTSQAFRPLSAHGCSRIGVASSDAEVTTRIRAAGGVILGTANLHELAFGATSANETFGAVVNPAAPDRIPGGSSGGSGAAVAADLCIAAIGTDTGGSVRLPASLCGVSGLRPTFGAVSTRGVQPVSVSLDTVGPLARSVTDVRALLAVGRRLRLPRSRLVRSGARPDGRRRGRKGSASGWSSRSSSDPTRTSPPRSERSPPCSRRVARTCRRSRSTGGNRRSTPAGC